MFMFIQKEEIKKLGYETVEDFVKDYRERYSNCYIKYTPNGLYFNYDLDSIQGMDNKGEINYGESNALLSHGTH